MAQLKGFPVVDGDSLCVVVAEPGSLALSEVVLSPPVAQVGGNAVGAPPTAGKEPRLKLCSEWIRPLSRCGVRILKSRLNSCGLVPILC